MRTPHRLVYAILCILLTSCAASPPAAPTEIPAPKETPIADSTASPIPPSSPGITTPSAPWNPGVLTVQATRTLPDFEAKRTPAPTRGKAQALKPGEVITRENAHLVRSLAYLGKGAINEFAWSPDGTLIAIAATSGIYLVDTTTFQETQISTSPSRSIAFSPEGSVLASSEDSTVRLREVHSGQELRSIQGRATGVANLAFSPQGNVIAGADNDDDAAIKIWDVATGLEILALRGHQHSVGYLAFSSDGKLLVSNAANDPSRLWEVASGRMLRTLKDRGANDRGFFTFSPDGTMLGSGTRSSTLESIRLWDAMSGQELRMLGSSLEGLNWKGIATLPIVFSPDGTKVASGSVGKAMIIWDLASGLPLRTLAGHEDADTTRFAFSPDGTRVASASAKEIKLWDTASGQELRSLSGRTEISGGKELGTLKGYVLGAGPVAFSPGGDLLAAGSDWLRADNPVKLFDVATGELIGELESDLDLVHGIAFSPDGKMVAAGGGRQTPRRFGVNVWNVAAKEPVLKLDTFSEPVLGVAFSPDGAILATGSGSGWGSPGSAAMWHLATGESISEVRLPSSPFSWTAFDVAFNPDGTLLAVIYGNGYAQLWDVAKRREHKVLAGVAGRGLALAFSPDGRLLATAGTAVDADFFSSELRLWNVATGEQQILPQEHPHMIQGVAFSRDGRVLASLSSSTAVLWDVETRTVLARLGTGGRGLAFSPDGRLLAIGGGAISLWGVPAPSTRQ